MRLNEKMYFERFFRGLAGFFPETANVLDVGCREGDDAVLLHNKFKCRVTAVDIESYEAEWQKRASSTLQFIKASAEALPFSDASFDAVWIKDALHHMANPLQALKELQRVTKPQAPIVVIEANRYNPLLYVHMTLMAGHQHFTRRQFRRMLQQVDPDYTYRMMESRCLPWRAEWLLQIFGKFEDLLEKTEIFNPWLTYQIAVIRGGKNSPENME